MKLLLPETLLVAACAFLLCLSPWTGQYSYEFSLFLSIWIFFVVIISSLIRLRNKNPTLPQKWGWVISYALTLIAPLAIVLLFSIKYGICSFASGTAWYVLLPCVTFFYAVSCSIWASSYSYKGWKRWLLAFAPTIVFSLITINDLFFDPQLSFYHPLGYFAGPVYDEWVPKFVALYTYRFWILAVSIWLLYRNSIPEKKWKICAIVFVPFLFRTGYGWHYSHADIRRFLSTEVTTKYVSVYSKNQDMMDMRRFAKSLDFYIEKISEKMQIPLPEKKFSVYVYSSSFDKKKWTGTANTLIGNPIQNTLQLLTTDDYDTILIHELAHLIAAPIGMPILKVSPKVGLMEGLATSFQPAQMKLSTHEWAKIMLDLEKLPEISHILGALSFWKENPSKVYLATGSFSAWIMEAYGVDSYKKVYSGQDFQKTYGKNLDQLMQEWKEYLQKIKTPQGYVGTVKSVLAQKPFYQQKCVHEIADLEMIFDRCGDSCLKYMNRACELSPKDMDLQLRRVRYIFRKNIHAKIDTTMLPLPSSDNSNGLNNRIQLMDDDFEHIQDLDYNYKEEDYKNPSFDMLNTLLARIYLAKHSGDILNAIILGNYVPDVSLTWPKDEYYEDAMFYLAKLSKRSRQFPDAMHFLKEIDLKGKETDFLNAYWTIYAQVAEDQNQFADSSMAYQKIIELSDTDGNRAFANLQIERLKYLSLN